MITIKLIVFKKKKHDSKKERFKDFDYSYMFIFLDTWIYPKLFHI